jgi:hypothetical protein
MAKTVGDALTEARSILNDTAGVRYTDGDMIAIFNTAIAQIKLLRPDLFIFGEGLPSYTTSDLSEDFPIADTYFYSTVYFLAGTAELRDDEFTVDGRAATLLTAFKQNLTS